MEETSKRMGCYLTVRQIKEKEILPFKDSRTIRNFIRKNLNYFYINGIMVVSKKKMLDFLENVECGTNLTT